MPDSQVEEKVMVLGSKRKSVLQVRAKKGWFTSSTIRKGDEVD